MNALAKTKIPDLYSVELEQALIGGVMRSPVQYWQVSEAVTPDDFYDPLHGRLWAQIGILMAGDRAVSPAAMGAAMLGDQGLAEVGGGEYLQSLYYSASSGTVLRDGARTVVDYSRRRRIVEAASEAIDAAYFDNETSPERIADRAGELVYEAAHSNESGRGPEPLIAAVDRAIAIAENAANNPRSARILTGLHSVDTALGGLFPRELTTLGAAPSQGKSGLGAQFGMFAALSGYKTLVFSIEMASEEWAMRYIAQEANVPADRIIEGRISTEEFERIALARNAFEDLPYKLDGSNDISASQIRARSQAMRRRDGLDLIVVDHLKHIRAANPRDNFTQQMDQITKDLKSIAKDLNVALLLISHLNREFWSRTNHRPMVSDLYGSSAIEQNSDHIWFLHREEYYLERSPPSESDAKAYTEWLGAMEKAKGWAEIFSSKRRMGKVGTAKVKFDGPFVRFSDPETDAPIESAQGRMF